VLVGPHETGRSGFTAYWGCPEGDECPGNRRCRDGFCGLLASGEFYHRATEGNHARRTPQWLKSGAESFSWRAPGHTPPVRAQCGRRLRWGTHEWESGLPARTAPTAPAAGALPGASPDATQ